MDAKVVDQLPKPRSRSDEFLAGAGRFLLLGAGYLVIYVAVDRLSFVHDFHGLGLSLWTPAVGLSIALLLTGGFAFAAFVFAAIFFTDLYVHAVPRSTASIMVTAGVATLGYTGLAWVLQRFLGFDLTRARLREIIILLVAVPAGVIVVSFAYCGVLYLSGQLPVAQFWSAMLHFWVGDAVGAVIVLPALLAGVVTLKEENRVRVGAGFLDIGVFVLGLAGALWMIFWPKNENEFQFFYLLFLPIIWIAIRAGFVGAAVGLLLAQVALVVIMKVEGYSVGDFLAFQMVMLALSATGLLLGAMVAERHETEERLRRQQAELSRMSRYATAGAMGLSVAHQVSQPLSTIATYLHVVRRLFRSEGSDPGVIAEALDKAEGEARRAREVLERIRDFLSRGKVALAHVDLVGLAARVAPLCRAEAMARGVQIRIDGLGPLIVEADPIQIEQVLLNLIANAVDAAADRRDGKGMVTVRMVRRDTVASIIVEDNGPGIAHEIADRLLEPFETTKPGGMGLGLPLSKQIIESHGGHLIWVGLEPQGTRFMFELRAHAPE